MVRSAPDTPKKMSLFCRHVSWDRDLSDYAVIFDMTRPKNEWNILYVHIIWNDVYFVFFEHKLGNSCWMRRHHTKATCHTRNLGTITGKKFNYSGGTGSSTIQIGEYELARIRVDWSQPPLYNRNVAPFSFQRVSDDREVADYAGKSDITHLQIIVNKIMLPIDRKSVV